MSDRNSANGDECGEDATGPDRKRRRVSLACQRCKSRKQKCDGTTPRCSSCIASRSMCEYIPPTAVRIAEHKLHITALEKRIADLESELSHDGRLDVAEDHWERIQPKRDGVNSLSVAIRDLSLNAGGYYVGATTHMSLGRLLESALLADQKSCIDLETDALDASSVPEATEVASMEGSQQHQGNGILTNYSFSDPNVEGCYQSYRDMIAYQFPLIHSVRLAGLHARRSWLQDDWEIAILHLVYAVGACCAELTGKQSSGRSNDHFDAAMQLNSSIVQAASRRSIVYLGLASLYCLLSPRAPGSWLMIGVAMKHCIEVGLHRKVLGERADLACELDKRLFWTCYRLDRHTAISTGRPFSLADFDIDVPLPLDINEDAVSKEDFRAATNGAASQSPQQTCTTLSYFIHMIRLCQLRSRIQRKIYRVDKGTGADPQVIDRLLCDLSDWERAQPLQLDARSKALNVIDYNLSVRLVLFLQLAATPVNKHYVEICASACAKVCETFKYLHQESTSLLYAPNAVNTLFLSGLTLLYCSSRLSAFATSHRYTAAIYACNTMLYVMAERWKPAYRYRNAFERVKEVMFDNNNDNNNNNARARPQSSPTAVLTEQHQEQDPGCNVTNAVDAFFTNPREVDALLESVLSNRDMMQDGWGGGLDEGSGGDPWIEEHLGGQLAGEDWHGGPAGWDG